MSVHVSIELPDDVFSALRTSPSEFVDRMRLAAAVKWYEMEMISQSKAAELAGVSRQEFLAALDRFGVPPFQTNTAELREELERA